MFLTFFWLANVHSLFRTRAELRLLLDVALGGN